MSEILTHSCLDAFYFYVNYSHKLSLSGSQIVVLRICRVKGFF